MTSIDISANLLPWSLQVAGIVVAGSLLPWLFRLDVAGVRYAYWRATALLCLTLPWIQPYQQTRGSSQATVAVVTSENATSSAIAGTAQSVHWESVLVALLAIGIIVRLGWLAAGLMKLGRLRRCASRHALAAVDGELQGLVATRPEIRYAPEIQHPITFGVLKPLVILPESLREQPPEIQSAVLGHELLHVKRRDWAWLMVEEIAVCLFWFHPASWWLASQIQQAREEVVDELAILHTGRRKAYVEALLAFSDATSVVPTAAFARRRHLFRRIALVSKESVMSSRRIVVTCAAMALIIGLGSYYAVSAFPLRAIGQHTDPMANPGPLESSAHAVTPENPIPRRIHFEPPVLPSSIPSIHGSVDVQVTLDDVGRIVEARVAKFALNTADYNVSMTGASNGGAKMESLVRALGNSADVKAQLSDVLDAAVTSVRQWRYDPPAEAPLTFVVQVPIKNGPDVMAFQPAPGSAPPSRSASDDGALRVGGNIKAPTKIRDVRPIYPPVAREAHVSGVVILEVRIGTDGFVETAHVLRSIPLLDQAALDAVKQWQFTPTLMNGAPIPVIMTATVNFANP